MARSKGGGGLFVGSAAVVALIMASGSHGGGVKGITHAALSDMAAAPVAPAPAPAPPAAGGTRAAWAQDVLRAARLPLTAANVSAIVIWTACEGGGWGNQATYNPLNLNPGNARWPGHPADGAWAFPTWQDGVNETAVYLWMPNFAGIRAALQRGNSKHAIFLAIVESPWAGSHYAGNQLMQQALRDS